MFNESIIIKSRVAELYLARSKKLFPEFESQKPFLKWAGGKRWLVSRHGELFPSEFNTYYEPFLGSGAVFFFLNSQYKFRHSFLFDVNEQLVNSYNVIKDNLEELVKYLEVLQKKYFSLRDEKRNLIIKKASF